ncbi:MAG: metallophosphoesterase [Myxococcota bacterium]|nr:metallophosphoesterase [Myxococcota bacterium]
MLFPRILLIAIIAASSACSGAAPEWTEPTRHSLLVGPYVMLVGTSDALVAFRHFGRVSAVVEWESAKGRGSVPAAREGDLYSALLRDLPPGEDVTYRVMIEGTEVARGSCRGQRRVDQPKFRFAAFGDTRTNHQVHRAVVERLVQEDIDFFLHTGDMVDRGGKPEHWTTFFQIERELMAKAPIVPAVGNHDLGNRGYYERYFFLDKWSNGRSYFVTDWGNLRVISLDITIICERRCQQYRSVERALAEGAAANKLMVMFLHHPPYSSGAHGSDLTLREVIGSLAKKYGVELVITGHDHHYERTKPVDGTTFIVSGSAGAPVRPVLPSEFTAEARTEPHYVLVDVDAEHLALRAINLRGEVFDDALIPANPPRSAQ